jgi:transposase-like protein
MYPLPPLTPPQEHVLALISAGSTISEAAKSAGVHRNTVHNWANSEHFRLALGRARDSKALFWREEAEGLAAAAVHTIRDLMIQASTPAIVRLKAAQSILAMAIAPPPEPEPDSVFDLIPSPIAAPESCEPPLLAPAPPPPAPQTVHNSAQFAKVGRNDSVVASKVGSKSRALP